MLLRDEGGRQPKIDCWSGSDERHDLVLLDADSCGAVDAPLGDECANRLAVVGLAEARKALLDERMADSQAASRCADLRLGLADACVIACAERNGGRVLTFDERDFVAVAREGTITIVPSYD